LTGPALAAIELQSIARGYLALDAAAKRADVRVIRSEPITPGKYWLALEGGEAEVDEALQAAITTAASSRIDHVNLAYVHPTVLECVRTSSTPVVALESIGAVEVSSICAAIRAADAALKAADVQLVDLHLARGIGGKGYLIVSGALSSVEASVQAAMDAAGALWVVGHEVLPNPDRVLASAVQSRRA
jgi:microcompartment protein CcmL/EutN